MHPLTPILLRQANLLASRKQLSSASNTSLLDNVSERLIGGSSSFLKSLFSFGQSFKSMPVCVALTSFAPAAIPPNSALLIGLPATKFCWNIEDFISKCHKSGMPHAFECANRLTKEFGRAGLNASFRSLLLSSPCTIGRTSQESQKAYNAAGIKSTLGMTVEGVDCDIGGPDNSCSEAAARIEMLPTRQGQFQFLACNEADIVTLNGKRIQSSNGTFPLKNNDIISVGARVFVFVQNRNILDEKKAA